jgi:hypothetical protein
MASYSFHFLKSGLVTGKAQRDFADDMDALDKARKLAQRYEVEIWRDDKWVARVKMHAEPIYIRD